jgi:hypothetical protein
VSPSEYAKGHKYLTLVYQIDLEIRKVACLQRVNGSTSPLEG